MVLSTADKAIAEAAHARLRSGSRSPAIIVGVCIPILGPSFFRELRDPHASHEEVVLYSVLIGLAFGAIAVASYFISRQRKRDLELVRFFEKHFPGDCSWKQEEKILAAAEDLRLKVKVDFLLHKEA